MMYNQSTNNFKTALKSKSLHHVKYNSLLTKYIQCEPLIRVATASYACFAGVAVNSTIADLWSARLQQVYIIVQRCDWSIRLGRCVYQALTKIH